MFVSNRVFKVSQQQEGFIISTLSFDENKNLIDSDDGEESYATEDAAKNAIDELKKISYTEDIVGRLMVGVGPETIVYISAEKDSRGAGVIEVFDSEFNAFKNGHATMASYLGEWDEDGFVPSDRLVRQWLNESVFVA